MRTVGAFLAVIIGISACGTNAEISKQEHLARGHAYAKDQKFREATLEYQSALQQDPKFGEAFVALGEAYLQLGDKRDALQAYVRAADLLTDDANVQLKAGTMRLFARQFVDAQTIADRLLAREPKNLLALILRANALAGLMQVDQAISEIQDAIQLEPRRAELYANLGAIEASSGKAGPAEAAFRQAVAIEPASPKAHAALGNFYWSVKRTKDAEQSFRKAVELEPSDVMSNRILATFYLATGRATEAETFLRAVADLSDDTADRLRLADFYLLHDRRDQGIAILTVLAKQRAAFAPATTRLAAAEYADGRTSEGHRLLGEVLARNAMDAPALALSARFLSLEKKPNDAMAKVQLAIQADPRHAQAHYSLGELYLERGDDGQATMAFRTVVELNPRMAAAHYQLSRLSLAAGRTDEAVEYANAAAAATGLPSFRLALVRALLQQGDLKRADEELSRVRKDYPDAAEVLSLSGNLSLRRRDYSSARRALDEAYKKDPTSVETLSGLIAVDLAANNPAAARARMEAAVARTPRRTDVLKLAARTYAAVGDLPKAEAMLKQCISVDSSNLDGYSMLGQLYYQQGRLDDGRREFEKLARQDSKSVAAHTMLGIILARQGDQDNAIAQYEQLLAIAPEAGVAANNLAWMYAERGANLERALALGHAAKRALPDEAGVADTLGWVYYKKELPWLALPYLREGVEKSPENPVYRYHLGAAYLRGKELQKAKIELERALKLSPAFEGATDARRLLATIPK